VQILSENILAETRQGVINMNLCNYLYNISSLGLSIDDWVSISVVKEEDVYYNFWIRCQLYTTIYFTNRYCHKCSPQLNYISYISFFAIFKYDATEKEIKLIWYPIKEG